MVALLLSLVTGLGCARWKSDDGAISAASLPGLPAARVPDSAAIVDVIFMPLPLAGSVDAGPLPWSGMDDSVVPVEVRRLLAGNGLRAGRVLTLEREQIESIAEEDASTRLLREANVASEFESRRRRLSCREGQPYTLVVRRPSGSEASTMIQTGDGVVGRSLRNPQYTMQLSTHSLDDGRVAVRLVPEIQHGEMKQNFVASDTLSFRVDFSRPAWTLDELAIEVPLSEDQAVVILPADDPFGIGEQMFVGRRADHTEERTAVIVQLHRRPVHPIGN